MQRTHGGPQCETRCSKWPVFTRTVGSSDLSPSLTFVSPLASLGAGHHLFLYPRPFLVAFPERSPRGFGTQRPPQGQRQAIRGELERGAGQAESLLCLLSVSPGSAAWGVTLGVALQGPKDAGSCPSWGSGGLRGDLTRCWVCAGRVEGYSGQSTA